MTVYGSQGRSSAIWEFHIIQTDDDIEGTGRYRAKNVVGRDSLDAK